MGAPGKGITIKYIVGPEKMEPTKKDSLVLSSGSMAIPAVTMKESGFLRF